MKKIKGSALVDYLIPTLLIGVVGGSGIYALHSSGVLKNFISASLNVDVGSDGKGIIGKTIASSDALTTITPPKAFDMATVNAGDLGGTPEQPIKTCIANSCAIDFGELILKNVPENFGAAVSESGSSHGVDDLSELLLQIADQLNDATTPVDEAADLRDLANLGHFVADAIEQGEKKLDSCPVNSTDCLDKLQLIYTSEKLSLPPNLNSVLTGFDSKYTIADLLLDGALGGMNVSSKRLGDIRNKKIEGSVLYSMHTDDNPLFAMIEKYDAIQNNTDSKYTDTVKAITKQLFLDLDKVIYNFQESSYIANDGEYLHPHTSPLTGLKTETKTTLTVDGKTDYEIAQELLKPEASIFTDIDSALICTTGKYDDTGQACSAK